jgi:hypothetical protein
MQSGLHAVGLGLQRVGIVLMMAVVGTLFFFAAFVAILVVIEAAGSFGT